MIAALPDQDIKILIVEDSYSTSMALKHMLQKFQVTDVASSGAGALRAYQEQKPHVVTVDINLPDMDGLALTRSMLELGNASIVVVSALVSPDNQGIVFDALQAGAYDVVSKSRLLGKDGLAYRGERLAMLMRAAAARQQGRITRRGDAAKSQPRPRVQPTGEKPTRLAPASRARPPADLSQRNLVAIGSSTGGPTVLKEIFAQLPKDFSMSILVAQHMAEGFTEGLVYWLNTHSDLDVRITQDGERPLPGCGYFPPSGHNLTIDRGGCLRLERCGGSGPCPSVDLLFGSVAKSCAATSVCLLLTGMGSDGAAGMLEAKKRNALTVAQDEATSLVFGMPGSAKKLGAAKHFLASEQIASWLKLRAKRR